MDGQIVPTSRTILIYKTHRHSVRGRQNGPAPGPSASSLWPDGAKKPQRQPASVGVCKDDRIRARKMHCQDAIAKNERAAGDVRRPADTPQQRGAGETSNQEKD